MLHNLTKQIVYLKGKGILGDFKVHDIVREISNNIKEIDIYECSLKGDYGLGGCKLKANIKHVYLTMYPECESMYPDIKETFDVCNARLIEISRESDLID